MHNKLNKGNSSIGKKPRLACGGAGVHKLSKRERMLGQIPHLAHSGKGVHKITMRNNKIYSWFQALAERLRYVRVVCGDWSKVCGGNWHKKFNLIGIYFDSPYGVETRRKDLYTCDSTKITQDVLNWCKERGQDNMYRIVISRYGEYEELLSFGWRKFNWTAQGGYGNLGNKQGRENKYKETLYFSPHCLEF